METKDWRSNPRVSKLSIPIYPMKCKSDKCYFIDPDGSCDSPREHKRVKNADCHYTTNKNFIEKFKAE